MRNPGPCVFLATFILALSSPAAQGLPIVGPQPTSTVLTVTSAGHAVTTVAPGTAVTLTALVSGLNGPLGAIGAVAFCNASAGHCTGINQVGYAQVTAAGTATVTFYPGLGTHSYLAMYLGTGSTPQSVIKHQSSVSAAQTLTVAGAVPTTVSLAATSNPGTYALTGTVKGYAGLAIPTGNLSFTDTTGNTSLGSAPLIAGTSSLAFLDTANAATGASPSTAVGGDFNGDGIPDLAVLNGNGTLTILLGSGDGTVTAVSTNLNPGTAAVALAVGDFNLDGKLDIAVCCSARAPAILLGNGDGTFSVLPSTQTVTFTPAQIAAGDFTGDGIPDLVLVGSGSLAVLPGNGDGTFAAPAGAGYYTSACYYFPAEPPVLAVGDFNGDGLADLAIASQENYGYGCSSLVAVFYGSATGVLTTGPTATFSQSYPTAVVASDFNGDGKLDLAVLTVSENVSGDTVNILLGTGTGFTQAANPVQTANGPGSLAVGDFNGDGTPDLAVANAGGNFVSFLLGSTTGSFTTSALTAPAGSDPVSIVAGDFNGDGLTDVAVLDAATDSVSILTDKFSESATATLPAVTISGTGPQAVDASYAGSANFAPSVSPVLLIAPQTPAAQPVFSPAPGTYSAPLTITLSSTTPGATILYTVDGSTPSATSATTTSSVGSATVSTTSTLTIKAIVSANGYQPSAIASGVYTIAPAPTATPTFTPAAGTYDGQALVSLADATPGAKLYYTTNGTAPSAVPADAYTGPIVVRSTETIEAMAVATNFAPSAVASAKFTIGSAGAVTRTALVVSSGGHPIAGVPVRTQLTLTATVTSGGAPVTSGQVRFCNAISPRCTDVNVLGTAALNASGVAQIALYPSAGSVAYTAQFAGTPYGHPVLAPSSSPTQALSVYGAPTTTAIAISGSPGSYALTGTVTGNGASVAPTGTLSFADVTQSDAVLGTASLNGATFVQSFLNRSTPATGLNPSSAAIGDFNGDGALDAAIVNEGASTVTVLLGEGDGTFTGSTLTLPANSDPSSIVAADFNRDGKLDLAIADYTTGTVSVFLGNGKGSFTAAGSSAATGAGPTFLAVGDFNGDQIPDLAVANSLGNTVSVLLGTGTGTFTAAPALATGTTPMALAVADLNGDGALDLAVANYGSDNLTILLGNGAGAFAAMPASPATGYGPVSLAVADFNGDGYPDLAVVNADSFSVTILEGGGNGTFATFANIANPTTGWSPLSLVAADFNLDGKPDLAVANSDSNTLTVLLGNGDGSFKVLPATPTTGTYPAWVAAADFNQDGIPDLLAVNFGSGSVSVLANSFASTVSGTLSNVKAVTDFAIASYPGDANYLASTSPQIPLIPHPAAVAPVFSVPAGTYTATQMVSLSDATPGTVIYYTTNGTAPTTASMPYTGPIVVNSSQTLQAIAVAPSYANSVVSTATYRIELTAPATRTTLAVTGPSGTVASVAAGTVVTLTASVTSGGIPVGTGQVLFCAATVTHCTDVNRVGSAQLTANGTATWRYIPGAGAHSYTASFLGTPGASPAFGASSSAAASLTVTATRKPTATTSLVSGGVGNYLLTANVSEQGSLTSPTGTLSFLDTSAGNAVVGSAAMGAGTLGISFTNPAKLGLAQQVDGVLAGDVNGDGIPDLVVGTGVYSYSNTSAPSGVAVLLGNGDGTFRSATFPPQAPYGWGLVALADFNNDGKPDILMQAGSSLDVLLGNGDGTFAAPIPTNAPGASFVLVGDFTGDGRLDLAVLTQGSTSGVTVYAGNGNGTFTALHQGASWTGYAGPPVAGDFNGDGKLDFAVSLSGATTSSIGLFLGNGDGTFTQSTASLPATNVQSLVAADFNGDGYLDLAAITGSSGGSTTGGITVLLGSAAGSFTAAASPNLTSTPTSLQVADFNGDGKPDLAMENSDNSVTILQGKGDGTFTATPNIPVLQSTFVSTAVADFNGDGLPDLAVGTYTANSSYVLILDTEVSESVTVPVSGVALTGTGTHLVEASYPGDANFAPSVSSTVPLTAQLTALAPALSLAPGTYTAAQTLSISTAVPGGSVHYTTDGSTPAAASAKYTAPLTIASSQTVKAIVVAPGYYNSAVVTAAYTIAPVAAPTFSLAAGRYTAVQTLVLSDATPGATIYYTTGDPTNLAGYVRYSGPVAVSVSETVTAVAATSNTSYSGAAMATYTIDLPVAAPQFSLAGGSYPAAQTIALSDSTPGATIYYTMGAASNLGGYVPYTGPIALGTTGTITAVAFTSSSNYSAPVSATYRIGVGP